MPTEQSLSSSWGSSSSSVGVPANAALNNGWHVAPGVQSSQKFGPGVSNHDLRIWPMGGAGNMSSQQSPVSGSWEVPNDSGASPALPGAGDTEETPLISLLRDKKIHEIIETLSKMDPVYTPLFGNVLVRWISQANRFRNRGNEFIWNSNSAQAVDPLIPSQEVAQLSQTVHNTLV